MCRHGRAIFLTVGSVVAATAWWVIYTVVLAVVIVVGGFWTSKIGTKRTNPKAAVA